MSTSGCDLLQLIGLDMQYVRWKSPNNSRNHNQSNNQKTQSQNHRNGFQRNFDNQQTPLAASSSAGKLSQSNSNLKCNSSTNSNKNHQTHHRRRESSPWPLMGDDADKNKSFQTCAPSFFTSSVSPGDQKPSVVDSQKPPHADKVNNKKGCVPPNCTGQSQLNNYHQPANYQPTNLMQSEQGFYQNHNQHNHHRRNNYNLANNFQNGQQQFHQPHPGNAIGARRNHQNRYYNYFPNGNTFNGNFMPNNLNGGQKRFQNGRHYQSHAPRGRRPPAILMHDPSSFPLINDPRCIELINAGTPPDKFLIKANLVQVTKPPQQLTNGSVWDELSKAVWNKFLTNQQTEETYTKKLTLWKCLYVYLKIVYPRYSLFMVGSTMSGFGSNTSDVDMCLMVRQTEMDHRSEALYHLTHIMDHFSSYGYFDNIELIHAKVPILKFKYRNQGLDIDLSCNNTVGVRNTHLLYCYAKLDWRVRPLVLVVKLWAQWHDINDAKNTTVSSYSLALLVIHFLQCGTQPPVLPCLQKTHAGRFSPHADVASIDFHAELTPVKQENTQPIGQLLVEFFNYYDRFDYRQYAISVRLGCCLLIDECRRVRTTKNEPHQWKYLCIEEPFDLTNTARSVNNPESFEKIRNVIHRTALIINTTRSLESIFRLDSMNSWSSPHLL